jgi:hypothetical protein
MELITERRLKNEDENFIRSHLRNSVGFERIVVAGNILAGIPAQGTVN